MNEKTLYAVALSVASSPASFDLWARIREIDPEEIYISAAAGNKLETADFIQNLYSRNTLQAASEILSKCEKGAIDIIHFWENRYPAMLREISCPPLVLYSRGTLSTGKAVAIVGTRDSDARSEDITRRISSELASNGITVVSGIARGIDRAAHLGALDNKFPTVAVMANGIDVVYPKANMDIYGRISESGNSSLLSEYPPGIFAGKWTFVRRNRIISGLSLGTVVVKAGLKSGALITARFALEQNRIVFACGGNSFDESYAGCWRLIKDGAVPVYSTEDILFELGIAPGVVNASEKNLQQDAGYDIPKDYSVFEENSLEKKIISILLSGARESDEITRICKTEVSEAAEAVMNLELCGFISRKGNMISLNG